MDYIKVFKSWWFIIAKISEMVSFYKFFMLYLYCSLPLESQIYLYKIAQI